MFFLKSKTKNRTDYNQLSYWKTVEKQFFSRPLGFLAFWALVAFCLLGLYAPFLASSKPLVVFYHGKWYFPLFRYLFFNGFYTKWLDIFYNLLALIFPLLLLAHFTLSFWPKVKKIVVTNLIFLQFALFFFFFFFPLKDPASSAELNLKKQTELQQKLASLKNSPFTANPILPSWSHELQFFTDYATLNLLLSFQQLQKQHSRLAAYRSAYEKKEKKRTALPTLWHFQRQREKEQKKSLLKKIAALSPSYIKEKQRLDFFLKNCRSSSCQEKFFSLSLEKKQQIREAKSLVEQYEKAHAELQYSKEKKRWLKRELRKLKYQVMPLLSPYHWEDDLGGEQALNQHVGLKELTRSNRKSFIAALLFGIRTSLSVGIFAISVALLIAVPIGAIAGFYGGKIDLAICRAIEVLESMPIFFMLLMIIAFFQSKSIFLVISVIGLFNWTTFSRFVRAEFLKQKGLCYIEACYALGFNHYHIMFYHLLPNAIPPLLTLIPFAVMSAITAEAGLSFLGLGEEGSSSWGVLMEEGRAAFPAESYLLWPPAILLSLLLVTIAIVGDHLRDALDPKMH